MTRLRLFIAFLILCSCVGCDQVTKTLATHTLRDDPPRSYLADTVRLDFAQNPGGFLSLGSSLPDSIRAKLFIAANTVMQWSSCFPDNQARRFRYCSLWHLCLCFPVALAIWSIESATMPSDGLYQSRRGASAHRDIQCRRSGHYLRCDRHRRSDIQTTLRIP